MVPAKMLARVALKMHGGIENARFSISNINERVRI